MPKVSFDNFSKFTNLNGGPILNFYWSCASLPLGHDTKYVEEISLPFPNIAKKDGLFGAGSYTYYAGFQDVDDFQISFYEDSQLTTTKWITNWRSRIRNPDSGAYSYPSEYKHDIILHLYNTKGDVVGSAKLYGIWPTTTNEWPLTYAGAGDRLKIEQGFSIDDTIFEWG